MTTLEIVVGSFGSLGNTVEGNVTLESNTAGEDILVEDNTIDGNLECQGNEPDPTVSGNTVAGNENCSD